MRAGVICEGVTDIAVIENIIYGMIDYQKIQLNDLQPPPVDYSTPNTQPNNRRGGWREIPKYLRGNEFRKALRLHDYIIIQIDTDVCEDAEFDVKPIQMAEHNIHDFYELVKQKIINWIDENAPNTYSKNQEKFIFCIAIHSIECWLLAWHYPHLCNDKDDCFDKINNELNITRTNNLAKNQKAYKKFSKDFKDLTNLITLTERSYSLDRFLFQLALVKSKHI